MNTFTAIALCCLAGCASSPSDPTVASKGEAASPQNPATGELTTEKISALQRQGYKLVDRDGQTLFCRSEKKTGTKITRETVCMTEKQIESLRDQTQRRLGEITRERTPPPSK